jgi:hypothetical protein
MWGTTPTCDELTGNFGSALEGALVGDRHLFRLFATDYSQGILGLLQHYPRNSRRGCVDVRR